MGDVALWFVGLLGLLAAAIFASARGRAAPFDVVGRPIIAIAGAAYVGIVVAAVWAWGGAAATEGRATQVRSGALVRVRVDGVRVALDAPVVIGHAANAVLRVPGSGDEIARIERGGRGVEVHGVRLAAVRTTWEAAATQRGCAASDARFALPVGAAVVAVECVDGQPARAFVVRHAREDAVLVAPLAWRGRFVAEQLTVRAGDALRVGGDEPIAGLTSWDVIAPRGAAAMLAVPADPTDCGAWQPETGALLAWLTSLIQGRGDGGRALDGGCAVDAGVFALAAVPLVPDADAVSDRGLRAALVLGGPALGLMIALLVAARRDRRNRSLARALRLCLLGASLTALCCWRLLWAYRIDMLRDLASMGARLVENQLSVMALGGALAGNAVLAHEALAEATPGRRAMAAVLGWVMWLAISGLVMFGGVLPPVTFSRAGVLMLSLAAATAPVLIPWLAARAPRWSPAVALGAIAVLGVVGKSAAPRSALIKLSIAYAIVLAGHAALRRVLVRETSMVGRAACLSALGAALAMSARYDAGVTLAIAGLGLVLAMLVAGHDAAYDASQAAHIGVLEREHARLLAVHGAAGIALAIGVATCAIAADDRTLIAQGAAFVVHAPLVVAALFVAAAIVARAHRRGWLPWMCAALASLAMWSARDAVVERATAGDTVGARRVAAVLEPGYAVLRDERTFVANASAWREAALPRAEDALDAWRGEGYFGARVRDLGVSRSIDNDYLPILIAREAGIAGLMQTIGLLLAIALGAGALASVRLQHASRAHRARWLITAVVGGLAVYQPLAALGVLPLTGISWPGLGVDSPADLWLFAIGAIWCLVCDADAANDALTDERVRQTARLRRARAVVLVALGASAIAGVVIVARAGACALGRVASEDDRVAAALSYAGSIACPWPTRAGSLDDVIPASVAGAPRDEATAHFDRELRAAWARDRAPLLGALAKCAGPAGRWSIARDGERCVATLRVGMPTIELAVARDGNAMRGTCKVSVSESLISALRTPARVARAPRVRVVSEAMGAAASDLGELVVGSRVARLRPGAPSVELAALPAGTTPASRIALGGEVELVIRPTPRGVLLRGSAELFVAEPGQPPVWRRMIHGGEVLLDRVTLIAAGPAAQRRIALFRPPRAWSDGATVVDALLADDTSSVGDRPRRTYPHGAALSELGWVNPFDVERSLGLDGWIHAALRADQPASASCGTLAPPAIDKSRVCSRSPLDGVLECRVALQPELASRLRAIADAVLASPRAHTGRDVTPVRMAYTVLRGDTGELLAQGNVVPGRAPLAYAPVDAEAEAALIALREARGEADAERVEWNLPIAVGSTFKPIIARAAEQTFPSALAALTLTASGHATGCKAHRGVAVDPLFGHCPPSTLADPPNTADVNDYLARSLNWYQAAVGVLGLGLPSASSAPFAGAFTVNGEAVTLADIAASDITSWPTTSALQIADARGPILDGHSLVLDGMRRAPMWSRVEALLGRPLCTLGDRARCEAAAERADVCAARGLPIAAPSRDLRYLMSLGPDQLDLYGDGHNAQRKVAMREYFQLLRGSGLHSVGSLAQLTDAFGRVIYDPSPGAPRLAASWFPAPAVGVVPAWSCAKASGHAPTVLGADGGLCAVVQGAGTAHAHLGELLRDPSIVIYGAKTGTIDSLVDIARRPAACKAWNERHPAATQLACGKTPPDDSLFVIAFGVVTPRGLVPITLGLQLQRGAKGSAAHVTPELVRAIADYVRGAR